VFVWHAFEKIDQSGRSEEMDTRGSVREMKQRVVAERTRKNSIAPASKANEASNQAPAPARLHTLDLHRLAPTCLDDAHKSNPEFGCEANQFVG